MKHPKVLVSAVSGMGKTTLLKDLEEVLVFSRDGKPYPYAQPHVNIPDFVKIAEVIEAFNTKIPAYKERFGKVPKIIAIDSLSTILLDIETSCLQRIANYPYAEVGKEIAMLVRYLEALSEQFTLVVLSHSHHNEGTGSYNLVNAGGSYGKKGGFYSEVNYAISMSIDGSKRKIHCNNPTLLARASHGGFPDSVESKDFSLQKYLETLYGLSDEAESWAI